jgi:hypothetical protein
MNVIAEPEATASGSVRFPGQGSETLHDAWPAAPDLRCRWCGAEHLVAESAFCGNCKAPRRPLGYGLTTLSILVKSLAIPLALGVMTCVFTNWQQMNARALDEHQKLVAAYIDFGRTHSDYRQASSEILFLALSPKDTVPSKDLRGAVLRLDQAFDSVGSKLAPFEEYDRSMAGFASPFPDGKTALEETWLNCFLHPYFTDAPEKPSYWNVITEQMHRCDDKTCPTDAAMNIARVLDKVESGTCRGGIPAAKQNFVWFWNELKRVMAENPRH